MSPVARSEEKQLFLQARFFFGIFFIIIIIIIIIVIIIVIVIVIVIIIIIIKNNISARAQISAHFQGQKFNKCTGPSCLKAH